MIYGQYEWQRGRPVALWVIRRAEESLYTIAANILWVKGAMRVKKTHR